MYISDNNVSCLEFNKDVCLCVRARAYIYTHMYVCMYTYILLKYLYGFESKNKRNHIVYNGMSSSRQQTSIMHYMFVHLIYLY